MSIVTVHGPYTFGSKAVVEVGTAMATVNPTNGMIWTFTLDDASTRTTSLAWNFGANSTPATATGPGPHVVTYSVAGSKTVTATATGVGEGANPYPPAGVNTLTVTAVVGTAPQLRTVAPEEEVAPEETPEEGAFDPGDHTVAEVEEYIAANPDELEAVYNAEVAGKNRSTLVAHLGGLFPFDPGDYSVGDVVAYAEENPDELEDIIATEEAGKNRTTLLSQLEALRERVISPYRDTNRRTRWLPSAYRRLTKRKKCKRSRSIPRWIRPRAK